MELRSCGELHFIKAIKGGLVTKVPNVFCGQPRLKVKKLTDIYEEVSLFGNDNVNAERSCNGAIEEIIVETEPDVFVIDTNDGNDQRINNLDDDSYDDVTLKQIKERCSTRKRKHSQVLNSSKTKTRAEDLSSLEDCREKQQLEDDSDLTETLSSWRTKPPKNTKAKKKKCVKDTISSQEFVLDFESEEILTSQDFSSSGGDSAALVLVNSEVPEDDGFNGPDFCSVIEGTEDCSFTEDTEDTDITDEWNLESELNSKWRQYFDHIPLQMVSPPCMDMVIINSELSCNQSTNFPAIEFEDHNSNIHYNQLDDDTDTPVSPSNEDTINKVLDCTSVEFRDTLVSPPNEDTINKGLDCTVVEFRDDSTLLSNCSKDEITDGAEVQVKPCSGVEFRDTPVSPPNEDTINKGLDCTVVEFRDDSTLLSNCSKDEITDDAVLQVIPCSGVEFRETPFSPPNEDTISKMLYCNGMEFRYDSTLLSNCSEDEITDGALDKKEGSPKLHSPDRLLSTRKAISPSSQEQLCKAMESVDLDHKRNLKCKGKQLHFTEQGDKNGDAEGLNGIMGTGVTHKPEKKTSVNPKTFKRGSNSKVVSKNPHSSRPVTRLGCSTLQSCSKSAIAFSKQQMHDTESVTTSLTKELNSMKEIMDNMLRSEFCLNTPLRHKVNEARMAVKNATKAEESAKRCLSLMSRDCNRFCKIMQLADDGSSSPSPSPSLSPAQGVVPSPSLSPAQGVVRKVKKKIAFADEVGGNLCEVRFYEPDEVDLSESN